MHADRQQSGHTQTNIAATNDQNTLTAKARGQRAKGI